MNKLREIMIDGYTYEVLEVTKKWITIVQKGWINTYKIPYSEYKHLLEEEFTKEE